MQPDTRTIPLTQGQVALVDAADYDWLMQYKWHARRDGGTFYAKSHLPKADGKQKSILMHRLIAEAPRGQAVDHANRNGLDNRRANLRVANKAENGRNRQSLKGASSKYLGVTWHKGVGKWQAQIKMDGSSKYLGLFADEERAAQAYDVAARSMFGEFANPNFTE